MGIDIDNIDTASTASVNSWQPKIVAFVCNWCTYAGADLAGTSRYKYPQNVKIIRVMCSGGIDPVFILKAFERGADGVLVSGCHPNDCHYNVGNFHARRRWDLFHKLLDFVGIDKERLQFSWISASEGKKFADVVTKVTNDVKAIGPFKGYGEMNEEFRPRSQKAEYEEETADESFADRDEKAQHDAEMRRLQEEVAGNFVVG